MKFRDYLYDIVNMQDEEEEEEEESLEQLSQWITENLLLDRPFCRSTRCDYHPPHKSRDEAAQRSFSTGSSMEMRPETVQVCIDMWKSQ